MAIFPGLLSCFSGGVGVSSSSRVCDDVIHNNGKSKSSAAKTKKKSSSSSAPIPVSYFPINSQLSRL